ncbi:MAG TPA: hypothetical protein DCP97_03035 [Ruminococcaceae bacterium]|nr:hypothetical protein [Oscillospiraceae bacterium]
MQEIMLGNIAVQQKQQNNAGSRIPQKAAAVNLQRQPAAKPKHISKSSATSGRAAQINRQQAVNAYKQKKKKRRGNYTLHYILFVLFCLAAFAALSVTVLFNTENIYVDGIDKYTYEQIVAQAGIQMGDNLVRMNTKQISQKLLQSFPYIKTAEVNRVLPSTVKIKIVQAVPAAALETDGKYAITDIDGKVLETGISYRPQGLYVLRGINLSGVSAGQPLPDECREQFVMFGYLKAAIDASGFDKIDWIDVSNRLNMRMMYDNRLVIELGSEAQLDYKLTFVKSIIQNNLEANAEGIIDTARIKEKEIRFRNEDVHKASVQALYEKK